MANQKGRGHKAAKKNYYNSYDYNANRKLKLERHIAKFPEDEQAQKALKNIHHKGPRPSEEKMGWVDRLETLSGFVSEKKNDAGHLYADLRGKKDALDRAKMAKHVRNVERKHQHNLNYKPLKERQKGGQAK